MEGSWRGHVNGGFMEGISQMEGSWRGSGKLGCGERSDKWRVWKGPANGGCGEGSGT